jgi:hypothetical protein
MHFQSLSIILNSIGGDCLEVSQRDGCGPVERAVEILFCTNKKESRQFPLVDSNNIVIPEAKNSAPETIVNIYDEIVAGGKNGTAKPEQLTLSCTGREFHDVVQVGIMAYKIGVL